MLAGHSCDCLKPLLNLHLRSAWQREYVCELVKPSSRIEKSYCFTEVLCWQHVSCHATLGSTGLLYHGYFPAKLFSFWLGDFPELKFHFLFFLPLAAEQVCEENKTGMQNVWQTPCVGTGGLLEAVWKKKKKKLNTDRALFTMVETGAHTPK